MTSTANAHATIVLVDDHPMVRERLAEVINREPDLSVCGEAEDRAGALELVGRVNPKLAIVDLTLKRSNGLDLIKDLRVMYPDLLILVLSMQDENLYAERVIRAGAHGYITKQEATRKILDAIRQVMAGKVFLSEELSAEILSRMLGKTKGAVRSLDVLSDRELQVFGLVGEGFGTRQIAEQLGLDVKTVETYRTRIKEKLELKDASELLRQAIAWRRDHPNE
ncbi:response regulator transcription factor [Luteolibacter flavescens]|uniref:Response regulator transcription factor n=1 Tax=Luteolibacter flavescens TaxID=1859460 RepID=A0ABT3FUH8_9BACT|nr:response regulator transcription factor [Luteolibacter flavescens]MCW1887240.1 response regulator transcription factor [Luteolibacter flavescens]